MAIQITREEYEKKFGNSPDVVKKQPIKITREEYEKKFGKKTINTFQDIPVLGQLTDFGIGLGSNIGKAGLSVGQAGIKGVGALADVISEGTSERFTQPLIENIEKIKTNVYDKPFAKSLDTVSGKTGEFVGTAATYLTPSSKVTKAQQGITNFVSKIPAQTKLAKAGVSTLGVVGRAIPEAVSSGIVGLGISGGDVDRAKTDAYLAGGFSIGLGAMGATARGIKESGSLKGIYSKTTGIPKTAFDAVDGLGINQGATPEEALSKSRNAVKLLRQKNTLEWQQTIPKITEKYTGQRIIFNEKEIAKFLKVADEFGIDPDLIPQNMKNVSALESINLMKGLNELDSLAVKVSPKGATTRQIKKEFRDKIIEGFGGEESEIGKLWANYARKQEIISNLDDIVSTYKTKPKSTVTAKNRLMAIFDENKPEFLKAVKDIESELGINLTRDIASTKFKNVLPQGILKADGGLPTKAGIVDKIVKAILLPVTSPKLAGKIAVRGNARNIGAIEQRIFGNYRQVSQSKNPINQITATIPSNVKNIVDNIPKP